ncbi:iron chelate uptake ABC transporter family permease subunit, partial [Vibrio parahaemolyticus]
PGDAALAMVLDRILLWQSLLPRTAVALVAGAALGLAGALLQRVLRNPIADPSTLGITAGAQLALILATAFAPGLIAL